MSEDQRATEFSDQRERLWSLAYRILGSTSEADDAVQETWLRLARVDVATIENLAGWLTTVTTRICFNVLRARRTHRNESLATLDDVVRVDDDPVASAELAESIGVALFVVLEKLSPAERVAFVLHDTFAVPFDEIARVLERSPASVRQLAARARKKVRATEVTRGDAATRAATVTAFLRASREGDFAALLELLHPGVVVVADRAAVAMGSSEKVVGSHGVATLFCGRAQGARPATIDGRPGAAWSVGGALRVVFDFTVEEGLIRRIDLVSDQATLHRRLIVLGSPARQRRDATSDKSKGSTERRRG